MGKFRIEVEATGGHGCQRNYGDGQQVYGCRRQDCPDCRIREFVEDLKRRYSVSQATLTHWPGDPLEVKDDLLTHVRHGSFPEFKKEA